MRSDGDNFRLRPRNRADGPVRSAFAERRSRKFQRLAPLELKAARNAGRDAVAARINGRAHDVPLPERDRGDGAPELARYVERRERLRVKSVRTRMIRQRKPERGYRDRFFKAFSVDLQRRDDRRFPRRKAVRQADIESA